MVRTYEMIQHYNHYMYIVSVKALSVYINVVSSKKNPLVDNNLVAITAILKQLATYNVMANT